MPDGSFGVTCLIFSRVRRECFGRRGLLVVVVVAHGALLGCPLLDGRSFECPVVGRAPGRVGLRKVSVRKVSILVGLPYHNL